MKVGNERPDVARGVAARGLIRALQVIEKAAQPRVPSRGVRFVGGVDLPLIRHRDPRVGLEELPDDGIEREAGHPAPRRQHERGAGAVHRIPGEILPPAGPKQVVAAAGGGLVAMNGKDRSDGHPDIDVGGAVEGVEVDREGRLDRAPVDEDRLSALLGDERCNDARGGQAARHRLVGELIELCDILTLDVPAPRESCQPGERRSQDLAGEDPRREGDPFQQSLGLGGDGATRKLLPHPGRKSEQLAHRLAVLPPSSPARWAGRGAGTVTRGT